MRAKRKENAGKEIDVSGRGKVMVEAQTPASNHFFPVRLCWTEFQARKMKSLPSSVKRSNQGSWLTFPSIIYAMIDILANCVQTMEREWDEVGIEQAWRWQNRDRKLTDNLVPDFSSSVIDLWSRIREKNSPYGTFYESSLREAPHGIIIS